LDCYPFVPHGGAGFPLHEGRFRESPLSRRIENPGVYLQMERAPVSTYDGSPIFSTRGASRFLGLHAEKLMKWRQPDQGPDYIQSGTGGPVRYKLDALVALREINKVVVGAKP
jgi:hypothetical protein